MTLQDIIDWYQRPRRAQSTGGRAQELYFLFHPRTAFLKTLPVGAELVDIGAGDGSLVNFREWPDPARRDLHMYAYSIEKGDRFDAFEGYEISDWNVAPPEFDGKRFDAIISAHFIEHIEDPATFVAWAARKLVPGGRAYVEWPSPAALTLPSRSELLDAGVDMVISRFDDDATHQALPDRGAIEAHAAAAGLSCTASGIVRLPWIEDELMAHFRDASDRFPAQAAFWSWTGWSQYLILEQPLR